MNIHPFGITPNGEEVNLIQLKSSRLSCEILTLGATLRSLYIPDQRGDPVDVVLGYDTMEEYLSHDGYLGATVGRYANRIALGKFQLNGKEYSLACNNGNNHLHGGLQGFSHRVWEIGEHSKSSVTLTLFSPDGEEGYPGNLHCSVQFALTEDSLILTYHATTDKETPCNLTNHSYFNLSGHDSGAVYDQQMQIFAEGYTPTNAESIPLGTIAPVVNTPMDFTAPTPIGAHIQEDFQQLKDARGYDHNYVIAPSAGELRPVAKAFSPDTGITMEVQSTLPGVQFYTANYLPKGRIGKGGCTYAPRHGFCLETQFFPNTPNQPNFPSATLKPNQPYHHQTTFRFP